MMKFKYLILGLILILAALLRLWQLGNVPASPDWDEAALGYNAYSIFLTGRDEYGKFLPVILRSFDDYKPALYTYFIIPFIQLFDLSVFSVRLPASLFGILGVLGTYLVVKELFKNKFSEQLALCSSFFLAISPWHIQFSRIAFEAQVGMVLNLFSIIFFLKGLRNGRWLTVSAALAALSVYVYQSEKVYLPILFVILAAIYWKDLILVSKKWFIAAIVLGLIISIPMIQGLFGDQNALMRAKGVSVFSDQTQFLKKNAQKLADDKVNNDFFGQIIDNRRVEFVKAVASGYISHFNLNWLFVNGDIERHHAPNMGLLYLFEFPLLLVGIYVLVFGPYSKKTKLTLFSLFLIAPIPASVTSGVPHAVRTINFLPVLQIFTALGLISTLVFVNNIKYLIFKKHIKYFAYPLCIVFFIFNFSYFLNQYFVQQNYYYSEHWQYGYKEAISIAAAIKDNYKEVIVSNAAPLDQSYIFFLFYLKYDPEAYQMLGGTKTGGFAEIHPGFDKFTFKPVNWAETGSGSLVIGRPNDIPNTAKTIRKINYLNGKPAIIIAEKN